MSTEYAGLSQFWTTFTDLVDTELVSHDTLYTKGLRKLFDRGVWLRDEVVRRAAALASVSAGAAAKVTGSVDLSTLTYDGSVGTLNGLVLQIQSDSSGVVSVTFGTGAGAPTGPAGVISAILVATGGNPTAVLDAASHVNLGSVTASASGTITVIGGSAVALLGFTNGQTATGVSSGGDGISIVGGSVVTGAIMTIPAGTLRSQLLYLANNAALNSRLSAIIGALSSSTTRAVSVFGLPTSGTWAVQVTGGYQTSVATQCALMIPLPALELPHGTRLTDVSVTILPTAHAAIVGLTMPTLALYSFDTVAGLVQIGATTSDPSATFTAYNLIHTISITGLSTVIDRTTKRYFLSFNSEYTGANAASGLLVTGATVIYIP